MFSEATSSNLSEAVVTARRHERNYLTNQSLIVDRNRNKICLNIDRHKETFLQITRKRHETWHRYDKHFREALKIEKDRYEKRKQRCRSAVTNHHDQIFLPSLITINSRIEPMTKVERRIYQVLQASQKLLDESSAQTTYNLNQKRLSISSKNSRITTARSSCTYNSTSPIVPTIESIDYEEYNRLMNESLKRETYNDFVDHFIKFRPEFREQFAQLCQISKRKNAVEKIKEFNQILTNTKDQRYYNLINSLIDFRSERK